MAEMRHPILGSVVNVREDSVERYTAAGYEPVDSKPTKSTTKKSSSSKTRK